MDANLYASRTKYASCFNPRARDGREGRWYQQQANKDVSIHAPVMDANDLGENKGIEGKFQSTRP